MSVGDVRVTPHWLDLREPADAAARSVVLVDLLRSNLPRDRPLTIHDLGCGTGSMLRWLAPRLDSAQHWVMYDRDEDLLAEVEARSVVLGAHAAPVTIEVRPRDITRLEPDDLDAASLVTASALLDMFTADELDRFITSCAGAQCPVLLTLSVVGRVELRPADDLDEAYRRAFNAHQRRVTDGRRLLGPDAVSMAAAAFTALGGDVTLSSSPWQLGPDEQALTAAWLEGWVGAAVEQEPALGEVSSAYLQARAEQAEAGELTVRVDHHDLLVLPR